MYTHQGLQSLCWSSDRWLASPIRRDGRVRPENAAVAFSSTNKVLKELDFKSLVPPGRRNASGDNIGISGMEKYPTSSDFSGGDDGAGVSSQVPVESPVGERGAFQRYWRRLWVGWLW